MPGPVEDRGVVSGKRGAETVRKLGDEKKLCSSRSFASVCRCQGDVTAAATGTESFLAPLHQTSSWHHSLANCFWTKTKTVSGRRPSRTFGPSKFSVPLCITAAVTAPCQQHTDTQDLQVLLHCTPTSAIASALANFLNFLNFILF